MSKSSLPAALIVDANVLIDYLDSDDSILSLVSKHIAQTYVPRTIFDEVKQFDEEACARLGIFIVEPTTEQLVEAGAGIGSLSFQDRLCLLLAAEGGWTCVTNDKPLRVECEQRNVPVLWGLELMLELIRLQKLNTSEAVMIARSIQQNNFYINDAIVARFEEKALEAEASRRG